MSNQIRIEGPDGRTLREIFASIDELNTSFDKIIKRMNNRKHYTLWEFFNLPISVILKLI